MTNSASVTKPILSVCATVRSRLSDLAIKDGQLIFIQDKHKIALDFGGKRTFYHQIEELATEAERKALLAPITGQFYFVINTAVLWRYQDGWIQVTSLPEEIVFIGTTLPELGSVKTLYVNKTEELIKVWDEETSGYVTVADRTNSIPDEEILALFK